MWINGTLNPFMWMKIVGRNTLSHKWWVTHRITKTCIHILTNNVMLILYVNWDINIVYI